MRTLKTISLASLFLTGLCFTGLGLIALKRDVGWAGSPRSGCWAQLRVADGNVYFVFAREGKHPPRGRRGVTLLRGNFGRLGLYQGRDRRWRWVSVASPLWLVVGALVVPSGVGIVRGPVRRRHRLRNGLCLKCGYDLSGCVEPRCSECGTRMAPEQADTRRFGGALAAAARSREPAGRQL